MIGINITNQMLSLTFFKYVQNKINYYHSKIFGWLDIGEAVELLWRIARYSYFFSKKNLHNQFNYTFRHLIVILKFNPENMLAMNNDNFI